MASDKHIAANRRNAQKSTGPKTSEGKLKCRRNAFRHGLTAETVIDVFENVDDYQSFEAEILAHYAPVSIVAHELTLRLASLLWRLRRATAIETGLLKIQAHAVQDRKRQGECDNRAMEASRPELYQLLGLVYDRAPLAEVSPECAPASASDSSNLDSQHAVTQSYLRASNLYHGVLDRLTRYEVTLWRQTTQILLLLHGGACPSRRRLGSG